MIYPKKWCFSRATLVYQRVSTKQLVPLWNLSHAFTTPFETHGRFIFRIISPVGPKMQTLSTVPGLEQVLMNFTCWDCSKCKVSRSADLRLSRHKNQPGVCSISKQTLGMAPFFGLVSQGRSGPLYFLSTAKPVPIRPQVFTQQVPQLASWSEPSQNCGPLIVGFKLSFRCTSEMGS